MTQDNDKEFARMLENVEEIPIKTLENWHRGDAIRIEMVAKALADGDIDYRMGTDIRERGTYDNQLWDIVTKTTDMPPARGPVTGYLRVVKIKNYMSSGSGLYWPYYFMVNASSLKKWIDNTFQPVPESPKGFMSEKLRIAVEISNKLYPDSYEVTHDRKRYIAEKGQIDKELDKANIKSDLKEWMSKIINPEPWS